MQPSLHEIRTKLRPGLVYEFRKKINGQGDNGFAATALKENFTSRFNAYMQTESEAKESISAELYEAMFAVRNYEAVNKPGHLKANVPLYFTPSGSFFIHGPDSLLEAALLASELLYEDEYIIHIPEVEWPHMAFENLEIGVCVEENKAAIKFPDRRNCHMYGSFHTSRKRKICFYAQPIAGEVIDQWRSFNPYLVKTLFPVQRKQTSQGWSYQLHPVESGNRFSARQQNLLAVHLTLDLVGAISPWIELDRSYKFLSRKLSSVKIPQLDKLLNGEELHIEYLTELLSPSRKNGFYRLPYRYSFGSEERTEWSHGELVLTTLSIADILAIT